MRLPLPAVLVVGADSTCSSAPVLYRGPPERQLRGAEPAPPVLTGDELGNLPFFGRRSRATGSEASLLSSGRFWLLQRSVSLDRHSCSL
jgi:hypothetical protein